MVSGQKLEFSHAPCQLFAPKERKDWDETQIHTFETEIQSLLKKGAVVPWNMKKESTFLQFL